MARSVIVSGGFGALGRDVAKAFADAGDRVARVDLAKAPAAGPYLDIGGIDLAAGAAARCAVDAVVGRFGGVDILVNVAGGFAWQTLADGALDTWSRLYAMNVLTAAAMAQAALPTLTASTAGRVINIGAGAAIRADAGMGAYAASKSGVHRLTESLAAELAGTSVTVNAILPSMIDTPANRAEMPDADHATWVGTDAIADIALFLASDRARAITGALVPATRGG